MLPAPLHASTTHYLVFCPDFLTGTYTPEALFNPQWPPLAGLRVLCDASVRCAGSVEPHSYGFVHIPHQSLISVCGLSCIYTSTRTVRGASDVQGLQVGGS